MASEVSPFGRLLRRYRLAAGLSQEALAERAGLSSDAVASLERGRRTAPRADTVARLAGALGIDPTERAALVSAAAGEATARETAPPLSASLPAAPSPLLGREHEEAAVIRLLRPIEERGDRPRLITLIGPGGVGKTRLAQEVARAIEGDYANGAAFVDLSALRDPALVAVTVARALGVRHAGALSWPERLKAHLREKHMLIVLDNVEQVAPAAPLVAELAATCPRVTVLATSRAPLRLRAEQQAHVGPLDVPPDAGPLRARDVAAYASVRLFVARARAVQPDFALTETNAPAVARICRHLDGLPLAIELAAARVRILSPEALLMRLDRRLPLLTGGARDLPARQQTLRAAIDWSYELLTEEEQAVFRRLAVFSGGCTLDAAATVAFEPGGTDAGNRGASVTALDALASLVDQNLLQRSAHGLGEPRFRMLETVREYGWERLAAGGEEAAARARHASYYLALAADAEPRIAGADSAAWVGRLEAERDNLREALAWYERTDVPAGLELAGRLAPFWRLAGCHTEGRHHLRRMLDADARGPARSEAARRGLALLGAGILATEERDFADARARLEESLGRFVEAGDAPGIARARHALGLVALERGDYEHAGELLSESLAGFRELGDERGIGAALAGLGDAARTRGDHDRAAALYAESLARFRALGATWDLARTLFALASIPASGARYDETAALLREALAISRELGDREGARRALALLGNVALNQGHPTEARKLLEESLALGRESGVAWPVASALRQLGNLAVAEGDRTGARARYEESLALFRAEGDRQAAGIVLGDLGNLAREEGDYARAKVLWAESAAIARERTGHEWLMGWTLGNAGVLLIADGAASQGVRLVGAASAADGRFPRSIDPDERAACEAALAVAREQLGDGAFTSAWAEGQALAPEQALAAAISSLRPTDRS